MRRSSTTAAVLDADGEPITDRARVTVIAGDFTGHSGYVMHTAPASGEGPGHIPAGVGVNLDAGGGLYCNASMVRIVR